MRIRHHVLGKYNAKPIYAKRVLISVFLAILIPFCPARAENRPAAGPVTDDILSDFTLKGVWVIDAENPAREDAEESASRAPVLVKNTSYTYLVDPGTLPASEEQFSSGAILNLKYFSGLNYNHLKKKLPGKTVSLTLFFPEGAVSPSNVVPNRVRVSLKAFTDGEWRDYSAPHEWTSITAEGYYAFVVEIPKQAVAAESGRTFHPEDTIAVAVEYNMMEGAKYAPHPYFLISDFSVSDIDLDHNKLKWQLLDNGNVVKNAYLESFPGNSMFIYSMGKDLSLTYEISRDNANENTPLPGLRDVYATFSLSLPPALREEKGTATLTVRAEGTDTTLSAVKNFSSSNIRGKIFLTLPLDDFDPVEPSGTEILKKLRITLELRTDALHAYGMPPVVISPLKIVHGKLIPFDNKWEVRDVQGLGGYKCIDIKEDGTIGVCGVTITNLSDKLYQMNTNTLLKGGIDWQNPFYRVELMRDFGRAMDLENARIEVVMNPLTDTTKLWQKPYRARLGILDINDKVMFGPNVSVSEGLPSLAYLDVSTLCPMPKGFVMPGFDAKNVKAILINLEAPHEALDTEEIKLSFVNLSINPRKETAPRPLKKIDFSKLKMSPGLWQITALLKDTGGYSVGINYPFPDINVPPDILEVPQIYPTVGMKPTDPGHFGISRDITRETMLRDFKKFAAENINIVRLFTLGHIEGVFDWDMQGRDIDGFSPEAEGLFRKCAGMPIEDYVRFLEKNEKKIFPGGKNSINGLEEHVLPDFYALLGIMSEVEKDTGKRIVLVLSLFDFLLGDGITEEGPERKYTVGEHPEAVTDPVVKAKVQAITWKLMKTLKTDKRFYEYTGIVEIMNEPANASALSTDRYFHDLVNFVGEGLYILKSTLGPGVPVSVGFRSWADDLGYWRAIKDGVDILTPHYWESLESYDIDAPGLWPLDTPATDLWGYLGLSSNDRVAGMGEISPGSSGHELSTNLFRLEKAGYEFALIWSYSGHDGHDAKPMLGLVSKYQKGSKAFSVLKKEPYGELKEAFLYLIKARREFDKLFSLTSDSNSMAFEGQFLKAMAGHFKDPGNDKVKQIGAGIVSMAEMKDISLNYNNLKFLFMKTVIQD